MSYICAIHHLTVPGDYQMCPACWDESRSGLTPELRRLSVEIAQQREEILRAFIAKYGWQPDEIEQVQEYRLDGVHWYVRKRV